MMQIRTFLAVGCWTILGVALAQQHPVRRGKTTPLPSTEERIEKMHLGLQAALEDLSRTRLTTIHTFDDHGRPMTFKAGPLFGLRRTSTLGLLHDGVLRETSIPTSYSNEGLVVDYFAVSCKGEPLVGDNLQVQADFGSFGPVPKDIAANGIALAEKGLRSLKGSHVFRSTINGLAWQARALCLTKQECMPCHTGSKLGDPLAIMIYIVHKADTKVSQAPRR